MDVTVKGLCDRSYVKVRPSNVGGRALFGVYLGPQEDDFGAGWVYDFATQRFFIVANENCQMVPHYSVTGGLKHLEVSVSGFGVGVVIEEWVSGGSYHARVQSSAGCTTTATITAITVQVPPVP